MSRFNKGTAAVVAGALATILFSVFPDFFASLGVDNAGLTSLLSTLLVAVAVVAGPKNTA